MSETVQKEAKSFETYFFAGLALDPIHVGTGGSHLGRVDNTIVRDPVTKLPKIPGSSLAGVMRSYVAMRLEDESPRFSPDGKPEPYFPNCAGQGSGKDGHCGYHGCKVCTAFGFATKGAGGGFAGLASFSDVQLLLFPVATELGPRWITSAMALRQSGLPEYRDLDDFPHERKALTFHPDQGEGPHYINLGWLYLELEKNTDQQLDRLPEVIKTKGIPEYITSKICVVSDTLFPHIVNSNLEVRTSVAIDPATGAAENGALFTYEAIPRGAVMSWDLVCRNPQHFKISNQPITAFDSPAAVKETIEKSFTYLEHLGIGGMSGRGMGRMRILSANGTAAKERE